MLYSSKFLLYCVRKVGRACKETINHPQIFHLKRKVESEVNSLFYNMFTGYVYPMLIGKKP